MEKVIELRTAFTRWPAPDPSVPARWLQDHPAAACKSCEYVGNFCLLTVEVDQATADAIDAELAAESAHVKTYIAPGTDPIPRGRHFMPRKETD